MDRYLEKSEAHRTFFINIILMIEKNCRSKRYDLTIKRTMYWSEEKVLGTKKCTLKTELN